MRGSTASARAIAMRWRWPPESVMPRSPMTVSYPCGSRSTNSCACASRATRSTSSSERSARPNAMFSRTVAEKRKGSCEMTPTARAQRVERHVADVDAVDRHASGGDVVEARHERRERRLARARVADERDRAAGGDVEVDVLEHGPAVHVLERHVLEADVARARLQARCAGTVGDLLGLVEHLEDALAGRGRALRLADPHAERAQRRDEHVHVQREGDEAADAERVVGDHARADEQHGGRSRAAGRTR